MLVLLKYVRPYAILFFNQRIADPNFPIQRSASPLRVKGFGVCV